MLLPQGAYEFGCLLLGESEVAGAGAVVNGVSGGEQGAVPAYSLCLRKRAEVPNE